MFCRHGRFFGFFESRLCDIVNDRLKIPSFVNVLIKHLPGTLFRDQRRIMTFNNCHITSLNEERNPNCVLVALALSCRQMVSARLINPLPENPFVFSGAESRIRPILETQGQLEKKV